MRHTCSIDHDEWTLVAGPAMIMWCLEVVGMGRKGVFIVSFALTALTEAPIGRRAPGCNHATNPYRELPSQHEVIGTSCREAQYGGWRLTGSVTGEMGRAPRGEAMKNAFEDVATLDAEWSS